MLNNILWLLILLIYIGCLSSDKKEQFTEQNIKTKIIYGLKAIDEIFNDNNIYYTIAYGTLLGAVRHWGMIPWDDDADINVWRKDYHKIIGLKDEFKKRGLIMKADWKLIKIYFDDTEYPFIDIFINDIENNKVVRCSKPFDKKCNYIDRNNTWWWKWIEYPVEWIEERKRLNFDTIKVWAPIESEKILKFWYGEKCLIECKSPEIDHQGNGYVKPESLDCGKLPKPQL